MTTNTNTAPRTTAHTACTHPRTKVARAACRRARAGVTPKATKVVLPPTYPAVIAKGSKVVHFANGDTFACTKKNILDSAERVDALAECVTCKNCVKNVDPTSL
jgi:hypothetical protein